ncbi:hypothetical protein BT96DRAFT_945801 [Gymnopus androsaceus JB14]|uniref:Uncharacterized protein n=1 Tax=Gymnopus androsaceus JB14 TaxID=1447944 RepID=A0A6A4H0G0_9AGAR|nr:hypothetical protein BT96DRAFT_945801 [Gymnopus androsaceus JB14]
MTAIWFQAGYTGSIDYNAIETNTSDYYKPTLPPTHMKLKSAGITGGWFQDLFEYLMANYCSSGRVFMLKKPSPVASDVSNAPPPDLITETAAPVANLGTPEAEIVSSKVTDDDLHTPLAATEQKIPEATTLPIPLPNTPNAAHPMTPIMDMDTAMASPLATSPLHSDLVDSNTAVNLSLDENNTALKNMHNNEDEDWMDTLEDTEPLDTETKFTAPDPNANVRMNHTDAGTSSGPDPKGNLSTDIMKTNGKKGAGAKKLREHKAQVVQDEQVDTTHMPLCHSKQKIEQTKADNDGTNGTQRKFGKNHA